MRKEKRKIYKHKYEGEKIKILIVRECLQSFKVYANKNQKWKRQYTLLNSSVGKESACQCRRPWFNSWVRKIPWRRERLPTPLFWSGEFHGLYSPWGHKESDTTKLLSLSKLTLKIRSRKKPHCYPKLSSQKAPIQIMSQVSSKKPSKNNFNCLKFSNTDGENTNCWFFSKACMIVKQKSDKYSRKKTTIV